MWTTGNFDFYVYIPLLCEIYFPVNVNETHFWFRTLQKHDYCLFVAKMGRLQLVAYVASKKRCDMPYISWHQYKKSTTFVHLDGKVAELGVQALNFHSNPEAIIYTK